VRGQRNNHRPAIILQARQEFPDNADVKLIWGKRIATTSGIETAQAQEINFKVRPAFEAQFGCERENAQAACIPVTPMTLSFSAPISADNVKRIAIVAPGAIVTVVDEDGRLIRRPQKRASQVVFVYDSLEGVLDLFAPGQRRLKEDLRRIFCMVILHVDDGAGQCCGPTYDLSNLLSRSFSFPTDVTDRIEEVRIRRMHLSLGGSDTRRIILVVDAKGSREEV